MIFQSGTIRTVFTGTKRTVLSPDLIQ